MSSQARNEQTSVPVPDEDPTAALPGHLRDIVLRQLAGEAPNAAGSDDLTAIVRPASLPLSAGQQRLWYMHEINPGSIEYNMQLPLRLIGKLDTDALSRALNRVVARHESLRTTFEPGTGRGVQVVHPPSGVEIQTVDLSAGDRDDAVRRCLIEDARTPFDLRRGPLLRTRLGRLGPREHLLVLSAHHIVADGWSMGILMNELGTLYATEVRGGQADLDALPVQYADYAVWQERLLSAAALDGQLDYWRRQLASLRVLDLPTDLPRPPVRTGAGAAYQFEIPSTTLSGLRRVARDHAATLFMTLVAAVQVLLARVSGENDIAVATAISGRSRVELENVIGFFVNTLVLRSQVVESQTFGEFLDAVRLTVLDAFANQEVPFQRLVEIVHPERDPSRPPLAAVMVNLHTTPQHQRSQTAGLTMEESTPPMIVNARDASFDFLEHDGRLTGILGYTTDLFTGETASRLAAALLTLLAGIAAWPDRQVADLPILDHEESARLTRSSAGSRPAPRTAAEMFADHVVRDPDMTAVICGEHELSYADLDARADKLARLLAARGVRAEDVVAVAVPRSIDMIVAVVATWKAGAAYLPLDTSQPTQRLRFMIEDSRPALVLTTGAVAPRFTAELPFMLLDDLDRDSQPGQLPEPVRPAGRPSQLAYVIYTSGSSGQPKGVLVTHAGVRQMVAAQASGLGAGPGIRVLQFASLGFDAAFWELGMSLLSGGTLFVPVEEEVSAGGALAQLIADRQISHVTLPPTVLATLPPGSIGGITTLTVAGEACPPGLVRDWARGRRMINAYGPTETTVCATMSDPLSIVADTVGNVTIGRALSGVGAYVLDRRLRPVPVGVPGELYISGYGLARGYLRRPGLTAERFVADPFGASGTRMYRSGDILRRRADGTLEFLGRADSQIKLRGFRIELGEVEAVLSDHPDVAAAAADLRRSQTGGDQLVGYVTSRNPAAPTAAQLREFVSERLPDHMVPGAFLVLDRLPLTASGKVDRRALPDPVQGAGADTGYMAPRTEAEKILASTWSELLGVERVGVNDNFFDLGGDSILGLEVVARAREKGLQVVPPHLLTRQTVAGLAAEASLAQAAPSADHPSAGDVPVMPIHRWFFENLAESLHQFNQSVLVELDGDVDRDALSSAAEALVRRHDALRLRAVLRDGRWHESTGDGSADIVQRIDLSDAADDEREDQVSRAIAAAQRDFPLSSGPLLRMLLLELGHGLPPRLFISAHHLAIDGVSWRIVLSGLQRGYEQASQGKEIRLGPRTTSFREWAQLLASHVACGGFDDELDYWAAAERDVAATPIPADGPGPNSAESRRSISVRLTAEQTTALLRDAADAYRAGITDVLLSALSQVLADWTGRRQVGIALEGHGRADLFEKADLSGTVGWFTALFPVALSIPPDRDWGTLLKSIKEQRRGIPHDGLGYGALRYLRQGGSQLGAHPEPQVTFNYLGRMDTGLTDGPGFLGRLCPFAGAELAPHQVRPQLIEVNGMVSPAGELEVEWAYSANVHSEKTVKALATAFTTALEQVIDHCADGEVGGCTPSDFPLARLDQASVDKVAGSGRSVEDIYQLTPAQAGMLFHSLASSADDVYVGHFGAVIDGIADPGALAEAWQRVANRTPALRTAVIWRGISEPVQVVYRHAQVPVSHHDLRDMSSAEQDAEARRLWERCARQQVELHRPPLIRLNLLRLSDTSVRMLWSTHHLMMDGWSFAVLLSDVFDQYAILTGDDTIVPPVHRPFRDYLAWLADQDQAIAEEYWRQTMAGFSAPLPLPFDRPPRAAHRVRSSVEAETRLSAEHSRQLRECARQARVTVNTLVQGAWALLLSRYCGQDDVCFGVTVSGRPAELAGAESIIGMFITTLPLRCTLSGANEVIPWLRGLQESQARAQQFEYVSLAQIQGWSDIPRGANLFDTIMVFENYPHDPQAAARRGLVMRDYNGAEHTNFALTLTVHPADQLDLSIGYDPGLFDAATVDQMSAHLVALLDAIASGRHSRLQELPMLSENERQQLLSRGDGSGAEWPPPQCVHESFASAAGLTPDAVAVQDATASLTFSELEVRANQLAHYLRTMGVRPGVLVGVCMERSVSAIVALLGVLKAGGAFVPADPGYPDHLLGALLDDSAASVLITHEDLLGRLGWPRDKVICLERDREALGRMPADVPAAQPGPDDLAYVIYTSGSTGRPKGVMVSHRNVCHLVRAWNARYGLAELRPRCLSVSSLSVDLFFGDLLLSALFGGSLVICPQDAVTDPVRLRRALAESGSQLLVTVPLLAKAIIEEARAPGYELTSLRLLIVGSEGWKTADCMTVLSGLDAGTRVFNAYGATETTVDSTVFEVETVGLRDSVFVPVGRPLANTRVYVLDRGQQPVPVGVEGEIYVGGDGVALGYWNRPDLTSEQFLPDPYRPDSAGARMYRTGDVGRWRADGCLEFRGRADDQVKVRGFRVEPGWVESVLNQHPAVVNAAVAPWQTQSGYTRLAGYVVTDPEVDLDPREVRAFLAGRLPGYAVPAVILPLDALPVTPSGKVDRRALPAPSSVTETGNRPRRRGSAAETAIAGIWAEVLEIDADDLDPRDNFFDLGGDSILSIRVIARIQASLGISLSVRQLFDTPTIAELSWLMPAGQADDVPSAVIPAADRGDLLPLSFTQQRLWFLHNFAPDSAEYNIVFAVRLSGRLHVTALHAGLRQLIARHEALRTTFDTTSGMSVQVVHTTQDVTLERETLSNDEEADRYLRRLASQPFDLRTGPVFRTALAEIGGTQWVLALVVHHIAADGWSLGLLARELGEFYAAALRGTAPAVDPLPIQYADFAVWQRKQLTDARIAEHLDYWRSQLDGIAPLDLPIDRPRPLVRDPGGAVYFAEIDSGVLGDLKDVARASNSTLFMVLVAGVQMLLARYTGQPDVTVGTATSGRNRPELEGLVGFFVNTVPLRTVVDESASFDGFLSVVRDTVLEAFAHEEVPFERLVDVVQANRDTSRTPIVEVMVALEDVPSTPLRLPGVSAEELPLVSDQVSHDLNLTFIERDGGLTLAVGYSRALFDSATIGRMAGHLITLLRRVVAEPARRLGEIPMLTREEEQRLVAESRVVPGGAVAGRGGARHAGATQAVPGRCLHELFTDRARRNPDAVALVGEGGSLSYAELEEQSNRLAHYLLRRGVRPDELVGVCVERRPELVVALLAVTKAGGAYLPLDPDYPGDRLEFMVDDAKVRIALAGQGLRGRLPSGLTVVDLTADRQAIAAEPGTPPPVRTAPDNLAYVIYTSGSTGRPKGVCVSHRNVVRLLSETEHDFGFAADDVWTMFHAYAFDVSVWEMWGCLLHGGRLVIVGWAVSRTPEELLELAARQQVTVLCQTPSAFYPLTRADSDYPELSALLRLRYVVFAGEALDFSRLDGWFARHGHAAPVCVNMYGITETTVHSTVFKLTEPAVRSATGSMVGQAIADLRCYLLDANLQLVPRGVPGEIYVAGPGLARGYLRQPGLTASRFVADSVSGMGGRMYRSGDLARRRPDGTLEYLGRADQQVKIRGFRVELGEVESALCAHPAVAEAAVVVHDGRLTAYVTVSRQPAPSIAELRSFVAKSLPVYAVPSFIVTLGQLPLTHNGKLDRRALPAPQPTQEAASHAAPRNEIEAMLLGIWADTLGLPAAQVGIHDSFFDLGGDSILGMQLVFTARRSGLLFSTRDIFLHQTVADLATVVRRDEIATPSRADGAGPVPLTPIQHWFFENHPVAPHHITQSVLAELTADTDETALRAALSALVSQHDALRLRYRREADGWRQYSTPAGQSRILRRHDLSKLATDAKRRAAMERLAIAAEGSFDLGNGPLLKGLLFDLGHGKRPWLFITAHHLVVDAVSWQVLLQDVSDGYQQALSGSRINLGPATTSFASWAKLLVRQATDGALEGELDYWRSLPAAEPLPTTGGGPNTVASVRSVSISLGPEDTDTLLHRGPVVLRTGMSQVVLGALAWAVHRWSGQRTVLVDLEGHGREEIFDDIDPSRTVGCFTTIFPVALTVDTVEDWSALIRGVRRQLRAVPGRGLGYGSLRYLVPGSGLAEQARPEILFNYHGQADAVARTAGSPLYHAFHDPIGRDRDPAELSSHLLEIVAAVRRGRFEADWYYSANVHDEAVIHQVAEDFRKALTEVARQLRHGTSQATAG